MIFDSKYYPKIMFLAITVVSLLLLFNIVSITDQIKVNIEKKSITGFASSIDNSNNSILNVINVTNSTKSDKGEIYSTQSYMIYYILIVGIIAGIFITFSVLRSTVLKNIQREEEERRL
jgi:hypothetical protein